MTEHPGQHLLASFDAPASMQSWEQLNDFIEQHATDILGANSSTYKVRLACEELISNIIQYSKQVASKQDGEVHIWLRVYAIKRPKEGLCIEIEDNGIQFDPRFDDLQDVGTETPVAERQIGGLGLYIARQSVDQIAYQWRKNKNIYKIFKAKKTQP